MSNFTIAKLALGTQPQQSRPADLALGCQRQGHSSRGTDRDPREAPELRLRPMPSAIPRDERFSQEGSQQPVPELPSLGDGPDWMSIASSILRKYLFLFS